METYFEEWVRIRADCVEKQPHYRGACNDASHRAPRADASNQENHCPIKQAGADVSPMEPGTKPTNASNQLTFASAAFPSTEARASKSRRCNRRQRSSNQPLPRPCPLKSVRDTQEEERPEP